MVTGEYYLPYRQENFVMLCVNKTYAGDGYLENVSYH